MNQNTFLQVLGLEGIHDEHQLLLPPILKVVLPFAALAFELTGDRDVGGKLEGFRLNSFTNLIVLLCRTLRGSLLQVIEQLYLSEDGKPFLKTPLKLLDRHFLRFFLKVIEE